MRGILWCILTIFGATFCQAQTTDPDLEFDFTNPTQALSIVGVYASEDSSCLQVMVSGQGARREEFSTIGDGEQVVVEIALQSLCFVMFSNLDRNKLLELRLSPEIENIAQISDRRVVSTGLILEPAESFVILLRDSLLAGQELGVIVSFNKPKTLNSMRLTFTQRRSNLSNPSR